MLGVPQGALGVLQLGQIFPGGPVVEPPVDVEPDVVEATAGIRTHVEATAYVRIAVAMTAGIVTTVPLQLVER